MPTVHETLCSHYPLPLYVCRVDAMMQYMDRGGFDEALESLESLIAEYADLEQSGEPNDPCDNAAALQLAF